MRGTGQFTRWLSAGFAVILAGCSGSDVREAALIGGGAAGGAAIGSSLGHDKSNQALYAAGGGAAGAAVGAIVAGPNQDYGNRRYREGYDKAQSDDIHALYWMKQRLERGGQAGQETYYTLPGAEYAPDGTHYVPHPVVVPIVE